MALLSARTDYGWITSASIMNAAAAGVAALQWATMERMNDKQVSIMNGYLDLAKELRNIWKENYLPCEQRLAAWALIQPLVEVPDYDQIAGRATLGVKASFAVAYDQLKCLSRYCVGLTAHQAKEMAVQEALATADARNYGYRKAEDLAFRKEDRTWSRIMAVIAIGHNIGMEAKSLGDSGGRIATGLGDQANKDFAGAMQTLGFGLAGGWQTGHNTPQQNSVAQPASISYDNSANVPIPTPKPISASSGSPYGVGSTADFSTGAQSSNAAAQGGDD